VRLAAACIGLLALPAQAATHYLIVSGIGGQPQYEESFARYAQMLERAARKSATDAASVTVLSGEDATREALESSLEALAASVTESDSVAIFFVGHGSYDGEQYKLNLPGRDITGEELNKLLVAVPARTQLIVNTTSASGAVLDDWKADGRTLITATRSGAERNATRFGEYWAQALSSEEADTNKNGIVTAQEAFDYAERRVADSFESDGALATEHPQLVGDGAERFTAARLVAPQTQTPAQRELSARLEALETQIADLRDRREELPSDEYLNQLQSLLVELALVQRQLDEAGSD
jgi:Peptidase C13 family